MNTSTLGRLGENELAEALNRVFEKYGFHFERFGGVEFNKTSRAGDVGLVTYCKKHKYKLERELNDCALRPFIFDAKNHTKRDWTRWVTKATDDALLWGYIGAIVYGRVGKGATLKRFFAMKDGLVSGCFPGMEVSKVLKTGVALIDAEVFLKYVDGLQKKQYERSE